MSQSYENLKIWKEAMELAEEIYKVTKEFPKSEIFGLVSQLRRAAVSISANIAEGSSRGSKKDYARFIEISIGSLKETESMVFLSQRLNFLNKGCCDSLLMKMGALGSQLGAFRKYLLS